MPDRAVIWSSAVLGEHAGVWYVDLKNNAGGAGSGEPPVKADVEMSLDSDDFIKMFKGEGQQGTRAEITLFPIPLGYNAHDFNLILKREMEQTYIHLIKFILLCTVHFKNVPY